MYKTIFSFYSSTSYRLVRVQPGKWFVPPTAGAVGLEFLYFAGGRARIYPCVMVSPETRALALVVKSRPMFERTFFITTVTHDRQPLFRSVPMADLFIETMYEYRKKGKFLLHEFVLMPDHLHLILTPAATISLERCLQFLKGGFSFRCSQELEVKREIWQPGFENHRIRDESDYQTHRTYIHMNPVRAGLASNPADYPYSSANPRFELDLPTAAKAGVFRNP